MSNIKYFISFPSFCRHTHDTVVNQKYDEKYPYSIHTSNVAKYAVSKYNIKFPFTMVEAEFAAEGHDLIEDARLTYNDILTELGKNNSIKGSIHGVRVADAIYGCTESTGRNRAERKDDAYYTRLLASPLAVFVKLCDIRTNIAYGIFSSSSMGKKYKEEFPEFVKKLNEEYQSDYQEVIDDINKLLEIV